MQISQIACEGVQILVDPIRLFNLEVRKMFIQLIKEFIPSLKGQECLDCWNVICGSFKALEHSDLKLSFILFEQVFYQPQITNT